jgi:hypothetical protein
MYCAGCGQVLTDKQTVCRQCGRPVTAPVGNESARLYGFAQSLRRLSRYWFLFAGLNVALGVAGIVMLQMGLTSHAGPYEPWPHPPLLGWTYLGASAWTLLTARVVMAAVAGMALRDGVECARPVAIVAAVVALTQFPIGLMLGGYTLAKLVGRQSAELCGKVAVKRDAEKGSTTAR